MKKSRTYYTTLNTVLSVAIQPFQAILAFINRTAFISALGVTYLGLSGLLSSIVSVLSLAELGIGTAMSYALYAPLAHEQHGKVNAFMLLFRKLYRYVGLAVLGLGGVIAFFLPYLVKDYALTPETYLIYALFVLNSGVSYFFTYRRTLLYADQKNYYATMVDFGISTARSVLQIIILFTVKSYILYLLIAIFATIMGNILITLVTNRLFNYLGSAEIEEITSDEKHHFVRNIKGNVVGKLGEMVVFQTDNILMSSFISLATVGLYSNYNYILSVLSNFTALVIGSATGSIGNFIHSKGYSLEDRLEFLKKYQFIIFTLSYFSSIGFLLFVSPFIALWIGKSYLFNMTVASIIAINFFIGSFRSVAVNLINTYGLSYEQNPKVIVEIIANIVFSLFFLLVMDWGVAGILLGTILSSLLVCVWYEPYSVFKYGLKASPRDYFITLFSYYLGMFVTVVVINVLETFVFGQSSIWIGLLSRGLVYLALLVTYSIYFRRHAGFQQMIVMVKRILRVKRRD